MASPQPIEGGPESEPEPESESDGGGGGGRWLWLLVLAALAWGVWLRVHDLKIMPLYGDEYHGARITSLEWRTIIVTFDTYGTHVALPLLQRFCSWLSSPGILAFRMPAVLSGLLSLLIFYPVGRQLVGRPAAALATLALCVSPIHVYYSRFGRAYAITIFLGLVLLALILRAERRQWRGWGTLSGVALVAAVTPWVHLSSAGFVAGLGLAAIGLGWVRGGARAAARPLLVFAAAAALCAAMFAPIFDQVVHYVTKLPEVRKLQPLGSFGISTLLAGGAVAGVVWMGGLPIATGLLMKHRRSSAVLLAAATLGPLAFLLALQPHGMAYAYSRYLLNAVPAMLLLMAWLLVRLAGPRLGLGLGVLLVMAGYWTGPQSPRRAPDRAFANTYLAMRELPAFNRPLNFTPAIYQMIAEDEEATTIIESPILHSRAVLLYRHYFLTHGKDVLMGVVQPEDVRLNGPYAFIGDPQVGRKSGAHYLVVHKDIETELEGYWGLVYNRVLPKVESYWNRGFMERHFTYFLNQNLVDMVEVLSDALENQLGPPIFEDQLVRAWKLKTRGKTGGARKQAGEQPGEQNGAD